MNITTNEKAAAGVIRNGSESNNLNLTFDGKFKGFDAFNYAENVNEKQCCKCNPPLSEPRGKANLCSNCTADGERLEAGIFQHLKQNRKVIRLQRCFACSKCFALSKFSQYFGICKDCLGNRDEPVQMRRKFAARALNNINKVLRGAMAL